MSDTALIVLFAIAGIVLVMSVSLTRAGESWSKWSMKQYEKRQEKKARKKRAAYYDGDVIDYVVWNSRK